MKVSQYLYFKRNKKQTKPYSKSWVWFTNSLLSELVHIKYIAWHNLQKSYWTSHSTPFCALDICPSTQIHGHTLTDPESAEGQMNTCRLKTGWAYNGQKKKLHGRNTTDTSWKDHKEDAFKYKYKAMLTENLHNQWALKKSNDFHNACSAIAIFISLWKKLQVHL